MNQNEVSATSDKAGITSALLCTVHCLVVPVFFLAKFWWTDGNTTIHLPSWWEKLDFIFLLVSFIAVYHSAAHTPSKEIKISLWTFWTILATAIVFATTLHWLAYIASAGLITTHLMNIRRIRRAGYNV